MGLDIDEIAKMYYFMNTDKTKVPPSEIFSEFFDKKNYKNLFLSVTNGKYDKEIQKIILKAALNEFLEENTKS